MLVASRFDLVSGEILPQYPALQHRQDLERDPHAGDHVVFFAPRYGDPVKFIPGKNLSGHFRRAVGYGPENPDRKRLRDQAHAAFASGTKTLLMLDPVFSYKQRELDFSVLPASNRVWPLQRWIAANKGDFIGVPVHSINETIKEIRKLKSALGQSQQADATLAKRCFVYFGGGVAPYKHFFHDWNAERLKGESYAERRQKFESQAQKTVSLYNALRQGKAGIRVRSDESKDGTEFNRVVGMPILIRISATHSTQEENGAHGLKGNRYQDTPQTTFLTLVRPFNSAVEESAAYQNLRRMLSQGQDVYIMGSPSVSIDPEDPMQIKPDGKHGWHNLRFVLNDAERQVIPVGQYGAPEVGR